MSSDRSSHYYPDLLPTRYSFIISSFSFIILWFHNSSHCLCLFVSQVFSPHHSDQLSERNKSKGRRIKTYHWFFEKISFIAPQLKIMKMVTYRCSDRRTRGRLAQTLFCWFIAEKEQIYINYIKEMIQGNRKILDLLISFTVLCTERPAHNIIYQPIYWSTNIQLFSTWGSRDPRKRLRACSWAWKYGESSFEEKMEIEM